MAKRTGGFIGQDGINAPDPATGVTGTAGDAQVDVSFTSPSDVGGAAITGYRVQSNARRSFAHLALRPLSLSLASPTAQATRSTYGRSIRLGGLALVMRVGVLCWRRIKRNRLR
jgi:hypothetical protein